MKLQEPQKGSTEALKCSENSFNIKHVNVNNTNERTMKSIDFHAPKASWELRFASKRLLASDFEALEVSF